MRRMVRCWDVLFQTTAVSIMPFTTFQAFNFALCHHLMEEQREEGACWKAKITPAFNCHRSYIIHTVGLLASREKVTPLREQLRGLLQELSGNRKKSGTYLDCFAGFQQESLDFQKNLLRVLPWIP